MLDECDIDAVYVVTLPGHLKPIVRECLARGIHTSIEKSPGMDSDETKDMLEASRKSEGIAIVSMNRRYIPEVLAVKRMLLSHGGAVQVAAVYHKQVTVLADPTPDSIICDAIHHVDLVRWLAGSSLETSGEVTWVEADSGEGARKGTRRYNAVFGFESGCRGTMMSHMGVGFRIQRLEAHAEDFSAYVDLTASPVCELYEEGGYLLLSLQPLTADQQQQALRAWRREDFLRPECLRPGVSPSLHVACGFAARC